MATCGYIEILEGIPNELEDLWHELILLENRLVKQKMNIQIVKLELSGYEEIVIIDKSGKEAVKKSKFFSKYSGDLVSENLGKSDTNLCVEKVKSEVNSK